MKHHVPSASEKLVVGGHLASAVSLFVSYRIRGGPGQRTRITGGMLFIFGGDPAIAIKSFINRSGMPTHLR